MKRGVSRTLFFFWSVCLSGTWRWIVCKEDEDLSRPSCYHVGANLTLEELHYCSVKKEPKGASTEADPGTHRDRGFRTESC